MAQRIVFIVEDKGVKEELFDFKYYSGFSITQRQKSIISLQEEINKKYKSDVLEVSSKSLNSLGQKLSAFNLKVDIKGLKISLENIFQSSKVFENGGPYLDLLNVPPVQAKKDPRLKNSGNLVKFRFDGVDYPLKPKTAFYDYIYCCAILKNKQLIKDLANYTIFTDIEFNHKKSINCQARSLAIFVYLYANNLINTYLSNFDNFKKLPFYNSSNPSTEQLKLF